MIKSLLLLFCLCSYTQSFSQEIHFKTKVTASPYVYIDRDTVEIKVFKYYITKLQLWKQQQLVYTDKRGAFLIDGLSDATYYLANKKNYDSLSFTLGIDSAIQRKGALGKDLDPTNGMYWAWQSGYIHFKLETHSLSNQPLQLHIGGYAYPFNTLQQLGFKVTNTKNNSLQFDLSQFLQHINSQKVYKIMSPCAEAVTISAIIAQSFSVVNE